MMTTFEDVCRNAGVKNKVIGYKYPNVFISKTTNQDFIAYDEFCEKIYIVGMEEFVDKEEFHIRILEKLAFGFLDYGAKESVKGLFASPSARS